MSDVWVIHCRHRGCGVRAALRELLTSELTQIPPYEDGKEAQEAWAYRRAAALNDAEAAIQSPVSADHHEPK